MPHIDKFEITNSHTVMHDYLQTLNAEKAKVLVGISLKCLVGLDKVLLKMLLYTLSTKI